MRKLKPEEVLSGPRQYSWLVAEQDKEPDLQIALAADLGCLVLVIIAMAFGKCDVLPPFPHFLPSSNRVE